MKKQVYILVSMFICMGVLLNLHQHNKECGYDLKSGSPCIYNQIIQPRWEGNPPL